MTVSYGEYNRELADFAAKHNKKGECKIYTSPMENDRYHKEYVWSDGSEWYEVTELIREKGTINVHGIEFVVEVEMWRTEFWSSDNSKSKYYYCK